jgi:nucleoside phosphorylase
VIAALRWEVRDLLRRQTGVRREGRVFSFDLAGQPVKLVVGGVGAENAYRAARDLIDRFAVCRIVTLGFAGALIDSLAEGDIIAADRVIDQQSALKFDCGGDSWPMTVARRGTLLASSEVITSATEKHVLAQTWSAVAVDMESAGVARAAAQRGIEFSAIKAITDTAEQSISIDFARCRSDDKGFSLRKIVAQGMRSQDGIRDLWMLARGARLAARALAVALCGPGMR